MNGSDRLFHAIIIEGPRATRAARAKTIAQALVCIAPTGRPCGGCTACRKVAAGIHPDVIPVERFAENKEAGGVIRVDTVRALRTDAFIRPNEAERKVYLIEDAERMNEPAQNVLLKLIEEGPAYASFLLLTDRAGKLLPTVRSRCVVERTGPGAGKTEEASEPRSQALIAALVCEDPLAPVRFFAQHDRLERSELDQMLQAMMMRFSRAAVSAVRGQESGEPLLRRYSLEELLQLTEEIRNCQKMSSDQVGVGHVMGLLSARLL